MLSGLGPKGEIAASALELGNGLLHGNFDSDAARGLAKSIVTDQLSGKIGGLGGYGPQLPENVQKICVTSITTSSKFIQFMNPVFLFNNIAKKCGIPDIPFITHLLEKISDEILGASNNVTQAGAECF